MRNKVCAPRSFLVPKCLNVCFLPFPRCLLLRSRFLTLFSFSHVPQPQRQTHKVLHRQPHVVFFWEPRGGSHP